MIQYLACGWLPGQNRLRKRVAFSFFQFIKSVHPLTQVVLTIRYYLLSLV